MIRQTLLEGVSKLTIGKRSTLGVIEIPGTTRHLEIEVLLDRTG